MRRNAEELRSLAARADLAAVAQRGEVMSRLAYLLEVFRGCMRGSGPKSQPALLGVVKQIADPLVRFKCALPSCISEARCSQHSTPGSQQAAASALSLMCTAVSGLSQADDLPWGLAMYSGLQHRTALRATSTRLWLETLSR